MRYLLLGSMAGALSLVWCAEAGERRWYVGIEGGVSDTAAGGTQTVPGWMLPSPGLGGLLGLPEVAAGFGRFDQEESITFLAALGLRLNDNLRLEAELARRATDVGPTEVGQTSLMLNAAWDIPIVDALSLSLGAGAGVDWITIDNAWHNDNGLAFAFQASVGLAYEVADGTHLVVTYRYLNAPDANIGDVPGVALGDTLLTDVNDSAVTAGVRVASLAGLASAVTLPNEAEPSWYVSLEAGLSRTSAYGIHIVGTSTLTGPQPPSPPPGGGITPIGDADGEGAAPLDAPFFIFDGDDADEDVTFLAAMGLHVARNVRVELELARRTAAFGTAELRQTTLMINAAYDIPLVDSFFLAVGAGIGVDWLELDTPTMGGSNADVAYQAALGLGFEITDRADIVVNYRYLDAGDARVITSEDGWEGFPGEALAHDVNDSAITLGLRLHL